MYMSIKKNLINALLIIITATSSLNAAGSLNLIPWPQVVEEKNGSLPITTKSRIVANVPELLGTANVLAQEICLLTNLTLQTVVGTTPNNGDIVLTLEPNLEEDAEEYFLSISNTAEITAGSKQALAMGMATLLQTIQHKDKNPTFPKVEITDFPQEKYRGALLDVAREPYSLTSIKKQIILNHIYKVPYLILHLMDDQAFTLDIDLEPGMTITNFEGAKDRRKIPTYTKKDLKALVKFAEDRGVILIPEIEVPGHGAALIRALPNIFKTGEYHHATLNIANPEAVRVLKKLVSTLAEIFYNSPYIHLGGDEADLAMLHRGITGTYTDPYGKTYIKVYDPVRKQWDQKLDEITLKELQAKRIGPNEVLSDAHFVYRNFLNEMNAYVKSLGKKVIVWESHGITSSIVPIERDVIVMPYDQFLPATSYIDSGFDLINASWSPLYIVGTSSADGSDGMFDTQENMYLWDKTVFDVYYGNRTNNSAHRVDTQHSDAILGASLSLWENTEQGFLIPARRQLPAMSEKLWNRERGNFGYDDFQARFQAWDPSVTTLLDDAKIKAFPFLQKESVPYKSFEGTDMTMNVIEGNHIALLIPMTTFNQYDPDVLTAMVQVYDKAYAYYRLMTGKTPILYANYHGKGTLAVVEKTCGAGCGYLGATGIEIGAGMWEIIYDAATRQEYDQVPFYELGRNFWLFGSQLNGGNPSGPSIGEYSFATGFAVYMRFKSMENAKVKGAPFGGTPFNKFREKVKGLVDIYEANPSYTFENTLGIGKSVATGTGGTDLFASFLFRLERDYGKEDFIKAFWKHMGELSRADNDQQAIDNVYLAASRAANQDLKDLFVKKWRWPISQ